MFDPQAFVDEQLALLRQQIQGPAVIATSGGVDSTVAAALVGKAIHKDLHCVFVDTGYMRKDEPQTVERMLKGMGVSLHHIDAREEYLSLIHI